MHSWREDKVNMFDISCVALFRARRAAAFRDAPPLSYADWGGACAHCVSMELRLGWANIPLATAALGLLPYCVGDESGRCSRERRGWRFTLGGAWRRRCAVWKRSSSSNSEHRSRWPTACLSPRSAFSLLL